MVFSRQQQLIQKIITKHLGMEKTSRVYGPEACAFALIVGGHDSWLSLESCSVAFLSPSSSSSSASAGTGRLVVTLVMAQLNGRANISKSVLCCPDLLLQDHVCLGAHATLGSTLVVSRTWVRGCCVGVTDKGSLIASRMVVEASGAPVGSGCEVPSSGSSQSSKPSSSSQGSSKHSPGSKGSRYKLNWGSHLAGLHMLCGSSARLSSSKILGFQTAVQVRWHALA